MTSYTNHVLTLVFYLCVVLEQVCTFKYVLGLCIDVVT